MAARRVLQSLRFSGEIYAGTVFIVALNYLQFFSRRLAVSAGAPRHSLLR